MSRSVVLVCLSAISLANTVHAATVVAGAVGYTNSFAAVPPVGDWSTVSRVTDANTFLTIAAMDAGAQATTAASVNGAIGSVAVDPPAAATTAQHCQIAGQYLQTWPTGNGATFLMCTLVNGTGAAMGGARVSYNYAKVNAAAGEESDGLRAFFSRTGTVNSWTPIPEFSTVSPGLLTADLSFAWPAGSTVYILWADDNAVNNPDFANQIDNFSVTTIPVSPIVITNQPQSQTNLVGAQTILTVGVSGSAPTFQWQRDNVGVWVNVAGATFASYTNPAAGSYRVIVSNSLGSVTSQVAVVVLLQDFFGPVMTSAIVSELGSTNQITITFNEKLLSTSVNLAVNTSNHFAVYVRTGGATNRVNLENAFYNSGSVTTPESFAVLRVGGSNWNTSASAYNGTINYYVVVNNVRDALNNVVAPNSAIGVSFPNNVITNVMNWNADWLYHVDWGNPFNPDTTIYQQAWETVSYDPYTNGHWGNLIGVVYKDTVINPSTYIPCQGTLGTESSYVLTPTLFRSTFVWPTNSPTNVTLRLQTLMDDGAIIYLNGVEIQRVNVGGSGRPNETVRSVGEYPDGQCASNQILNAVLRPGTNVLAAAVCQYNVPGANGGDIYWAARLDIVQTSLTTGAVPRSNTNTNNLRILASKIGPNQVRLSWWTNVEPTHINNFYNYTVVYSTNITKVGNIDSVVSPNLQLQPGITNGMVTNFIPTKVPFIIRLQRVP